MNFQILLPSIIKEHYLSIQALGIAGKDSAGPK